MTARPDQESDLDYKAIAEKYSDDVMFGRIKTNPYVKKAVERHVTDLEHGPNRGLIFSEAIATHALDFFHNLRHSKGEWRGKPLKLEPWQIWFHWVLFGWHNLDGSRRFRTSYLEVARKNGKTTTAAAAGLYLLDGDGEPGAEVYAAATKRDQAKLVWDEAARMIKKSPYLARRLTVYQASILNDDTDSKFIPLGRDSSSMDGLNVHGSIIDELHAHKTREVFDLLETATTSRQSPLLYLITTAGTDRTSICWENREYLTKILDGIVEDDTFFGAIYALEPDDDFENEENWIKANPNLGVSAKIEDIRRKVAKAKEQPSALNSCLRLHFNIWTQAESRWVNPEKWAICQSLERDIYAGRRCFAGLDLSSKIDLTALVLVFPPEDISSGQFDVMGRYWIPEDNIELRSRRDRVPYEAWERENQIITTPGNVIDYDWILYEIEQMAELYDLAEIAFDPWGSEYVVQKIGELGIEVVKFRQTFAFFNEPVNELEKLVTAERLATGDDPPLSWMAHNLILRVDPAGNRRPDKERSIEKIDGMVALLMGLGRAAAGIEAENVESVYSARGLRFA